MTTLSYIADQYVGKDWAGRYGSQRKTFPRYNRAMLYYRNGKDYRIANKRYMAGLGLRLRFLHYHATKHMKEHMHARTWSQQIGEWQEQTFGLPNIATAYERMAEEFREYKSARDADDPSVLEEAADVVITLVALSRAANRIGPNQFDLTSELNTIRPVMTYGPSVETVLDCLFSATKNSDQMAILWNCCTMVVRLMDRHGQYDLLEAVNKKMTINRSRLWHVKGDGTGQHVK